MIIFTRKELIHTTVENIRAILKMYKNPKYPNWDFNKCVHEITISAYALAELNIILHSEAALLSNAAHNILIHMEVNKHEID